MFGTVGTVRHREPQEARIEAVEVGGEAVARRLGLRRIPQAASIFAVT
jgi:hypothetical protein